MMIFFQGLAHSGRGFVGILWMNENTTVKMTSMVTSLTFGIDGLCIFISSIWFKYISKEWRILYAIPLSLLGLIWAWNIFQKETPKYYYFRGKYNKTRQILTSIGRTNGVLKPTEEYTKKFKIEEIKNYNQEIDINNQKEETSIKVFIKDALNRKNLLIFVIMFINCNLGHFLVNFYVKYFSGDIFIN